MQPEASVSRLQRQPRLAHQFCPAPVLLPKRACAALPSVGLHQGPLLPRLPHPPTNLQLQQQQLGLDWQLLRRRTKAGQHPVGLAAGQGQEAAAAQLQGGGGRGGGSGGAWQLGRDERSGGGKQGSGVPRS